MTHQIESVTTTYSCGHTGVHTVEHWGDAPYGDRAIDCLCPRCSEKHEADARRLARKLTGQVPFDGTLRWRERATVDQVKQAFAAAGLTLPWRLVRDGQDARELKIQRVTSVYGSDDAFCVEYTRDLQTERTEIVRGDTIYQDEYVRLVAVSTSPSTHIHGASHIPSTVCTLTAVDGSRCLFDVIAGVMRSQRFGTDMHLAAREDGYWYAWSMGASEMSDVFFRFGRRSQAALAALNVTTERDERRLAESWRSRPTSTYIDMP